MPNSSEGKVNSDTVPPLPSAASDSKNGGSGGIITIGSIPCLGFITETLTPVQSAPVIYAPSSSSVLTTTSLLSFTNDHHLHEEHPSPSIPNDSERGPPENRSASVKEIEWEYLAACNSRVVDPPKEFPPQQRNVTPCSASLSLTCLSSCDSGSSLAASNNFSKKSELGPMLLLPRKENVAATIGFPVTRRQKASALDPMKRHSSEYDEAYNKSPIMRGKNLLPNHDETVESAFEEEEWENLNYRLSSSNIVTPIIASHKQRISSKTQKQELNSPGAKYTKTVPRAKREKLPKTLFTKDFEMGPPRIAVPLTNDSTSSDASLVGCFDKPHVLERPRRPKSLVARARKSHQQKCSFVGPPLVTPEVNVININSPNSASDGRASELLPTVSHLLSSPSAGHCPPVTSPLCSPLSPLTTSFNSSLFIPDNASRIIPNSDGGGPNKVDAYQKHPADLFSPSVEFSEVDPANCGEINFLEDGGALAQGYRMESPSAQNKKSPILHATPITPRCHEPYYLSKTGLSSTWPPSDEGLPHCAVHPSPLRETCSPCNTRSSPCNDWWRLSGKLCGVCAH